MKKKFFIVGLILVIFLSVSAVSANKNETIMLETDDGVISSNVETSDLELNDAVDDELSEDNYDSYDAVIISDDVDLDYSPYNEFRAELLDDYGDDIYGENLKIIWSDGKKESLFEWDDDYGYNTYIDRDVGKYKLTIVLESPYYSAKPVTINVKISKATPKLTINKWICTTKQYATLKAKVKDQNGDLVDEGTVKFTINGKSYTVKVRDGIATKKVKLNKAKTYNYKATFSGKNYKTKTVSSKVYVKKAKKYYKIKYGKYSGKITYKQFLKLINAKNQGKSTYVTVKTQKYKTYKIPTYKKVKVKKTKWVYKKVLTYESFYYSDGSIDSYSYSIAKYYKKGWKLYGWYDKSFIDGYESYAKLKKKVKYISTKKVKTGKYKTKKIPYHLTVITVAKDGQLYKGDYLNLWADDPGYYKSVNLYTLKV